MKQYRNRQIKTFEEQTVCARVHPLLRTVKLRRGSMQIGPFQPLLRASQWQFPRRPGHD